MARMEGVWIGFGIGFQSGLFLRGCNNGAQFCRGGLEHVCTVLRR